MGDLLYEEEEWKIGKNDDGRRRRRAVHLWKVHYSLRENSSWDCLLSKYLHNGTFPCVLKLSTTIPVNKKGPPDSLTSL